MISYSSLLRILVIFFGVVVLIGQILLWRFRGAYGTRRKYMYLLVVALIALQTTGYLYIRVKDTSKKDLKPGVQTQIEKLDEIENSLFDLKSFIDVQKYNLRESEKRINELNQEREKLKPFVEADRKTIAAFFAVQEERNRSKVWGDRFVGVLFGVISSLMAAYIYRLITQ